MDDPRAVSSDWTALPEVTHLITQDEIQQYAEISGDFNPLHVDPEYAAASRFGSIVAHGPAGLQAVFEALTTWLGTDSLPPGVAVDVGYRAPVRPGDSVTARLEQALDHAGTLVLTARCLNQRGETVIEALVSVPRHLAPHPEP
jgi:acyl dehydratase